MKLFYFLKIVANFTHQLLYSFSWLNVIFSLFPDVAGYIWNFHLVTSCTWCKVFWRVGRGGGWVHPKSAGSMTVSELSFRNNLLAFQWATAVILCMNGLRKSPLAFHGTHFWQGASFPVWMSGCQLRVMTIASSIVGGCGLSYKCVEDGFKSTCVKFRGWNPTELGIW